jgi:ABC-2 type transport system permease protein
MGLVLLVAISVLVYISVFATMSPIGSVGIFSIIGEFLAGMTIPLPLMPPWIQRICMFLPFRWTADLPFRVYSGHIGTADALVGFAVQSMWTAALVLAGACITKRISRLSVVQGG